MARPMNEFQNSYEDTYSRPMPNRWPECRVCHVALPPDDSRTLCAACRPYRVVSPLGQWAKEGACRTDDPEEAQRIQTLFFEVKRGKNATEARAICATCPVKQECAEYAISEVMLTGIWGGMTERERQQERSRRAKESA